MTKKYWFDFPYSCVEETKIIELSSVNISRNDPWINLGNLVLTLLTKSNYDINFILSKVKVLALVYYITNDATERDCSQYQHLMGIAFVQNPYNKEMQQYHNHDPINQPRVVEIDKFLLYAFNCLAYNRKISGLSAANTPLGLSKFYISKKILKRVNIKAFQSYFPKIIF